MSTVAHIACFGQIHELKRALDLCYPNFHFYLFWTFARMSRDIDLPICEHASLSQGIAISSVICHIKNFSPKFPEIIHSFLKKIQNQFSESFVSIIYEYFLFFFHGFVRSEMSKKRMIFKMLINKDVSKFFQFVLSKISF